MTVVRLAAEADYDPERIGKSLVRGAMKRAKAHGGEAAIDDVLHYMLWTIAVVYVERYGPRQAFEDLDTVARYGHPALTDASCPHASRRASK